MDKLDAIFKDVQGKYGDIVKLSNWARANPEKASRLAGDYLRLNIQRKEDFVYHVLSKGFDPEREMQRLLSQLADIDKSRRFATKLRRALKSAGVYEFSRHGTKGVVNAGAEHTAVLFPGGKRVEIVFETSAGGWEALKHLVRTGEVGGYKWRLARITFNGESHAMDRARAILPLIENAIRLNAAPEVATLIGHEADAS